MQFVLRRAQLIQTGPHVVLLCLLFVLLGTQLGRHGPRLALLGHLVRECSCELYYWAVNLYVWVLRLYSWVLMLYYGVDRAYT